jgi:hypothetical protein
VNGLLCKLKDANDLAAKMNTMAHFTDETLESFGQSGRLKMEAEYNESIVINKYLGTLADLRTA